MTNLNNHIDNNRIAKNTLLLYLRTLLLMIISLYTSRVVLKVLGVEDFGVYTAVGGVVTMFGILFNTLSSAISRFITVELGKGDELRIRSVFSTSVKVQFVISIVVIVLAEVVGLWFLNTKMQIPDGRYEAAQWVLHFSIASFAVSIIGAPYSASIIAHEKMAVFAYMGILDAILKLSVAYLIFISPIDKLTSYALLLLLVQILMLTLNMAYSISHFSECRGKSVFDRAIFNEIWKYTGWSFLGNTAYALNTQGINMILNVYFGVIVNAARGIANQVNGAVGQFVNNFTVAVSPQIIKSYSSGDRNGAFTLVCRSAKFSFFLMYALALPLMLEVDQILDIWLETPPDGSSSFVIWTILASMTTTVGNSLLTLVSASGDIKQYQIYMALCGFLPFPLTWVAFSLGASAIVSYIIYFVVYYVLIYIRLWLVHNKKGIPYKGDLKEAILRTHLFAVTALIAPLIIRNLMGPSLLRFFFVFLTCVVSCAIVVYLIGFTCSEKKSIISKAKLFYESKIIHKQGA